MATDLAFVRRPWFTSASRALLALAMVGLTAACGDPDRDDDDLDGGADPGTATTGGGSGGSTGGSTGTGTTSGGSNGTSGGSTSGGTSGGTTGASSGTNGGASSGTTGGASSGTSGGTSTTGGTSGGTTAGSDDPHQKCVDRINEYRATLQLPPLARWVEGEACTDQQSADDNVTDKAHGNFSKCKESAQNTCPNWRNVDQVLSGCLQAMWDEGPPPDPNNCDDACFQAHGHYINMSSASFKKVACGFNTGADGKVWSNQNFSR